MVVMKDRAHKHQVRPVFKKINTYAHKWLLKKLHSAISLRVFPASVPAFKPTWNFFYKALSINNRRNNNNKTNKNINTKLQVPKGDNLQRLVPISRQYRQKGFQEALIECSVLDGMMSFSAKLFFFFLVLFKHF